MNSFEFLAKEKIWQTSGGENVYYINLTDQHLRNILTKFKDGKFKNRLVQLPGLQAEFGRRLGSLGKVLYE